MGGKEASKRRSGIREDKRQLMMARLVLGGGVPIW